MSQRELADQVGLSQNACWRRLQRLNACGIIRGTRAEVSLVALGLDLTVFVMIRTSHHAKAWPTASACTLSACRKSPSSIASAETGIT